MTVDEGNDRPHESREPAWAKVALRGPHDGEREHLWAEVLGDGLFRLDNLPWFAYGVSAGDVVEARATDLRGSFEFVRVVEPSGNRLVRCAFEESAPDGLLDHLVALGCSCEGANPSYIAVNVPPATSLDDVAARLTDACVEWEYANPDPGPD